MEGWSVRSRENRDRRSGGGERWRDEEAIFHFW